MLQKYCIFVREVVMKTRECVCSDFFEGLSKVVQDIVDMLCTD